MDRKYICLDCGKHDNEQVFGIFIRCPDCDSLRVADAEVWEKYGPGKKPEAQDEEDTT